jgi:DNA repair exonuclease SbcCD ATPase subunit
VKRFNLPFPRNSARAEELESTVNELENQLEAQQEEATKAISQWETSYSALETKANQLEEELFRSTEAPDRSMNDELRMRQEEILTLKKQVERLQKDLACNTLSQEQIHELESSLAADQQTLKEAQANLADKQELVESLETQLLQLRQEIESNATETNIALEIERAARESAERDLAALQETVSETEEAFATLCSKEDQIFSEGSQSKEDADRIRQLLQEKESEWHEERGTLIQELGDLKATLGELEEELRDASDALQACVTDEISEKATEVASQALRYQMEQLRSQIERDKESYVRERNLRLAAEKEVEALKTDLINVMGYIDKSGDTAAAVQGFTMRASEAMQRREREELDEMRKALERALHELKSAQAAERKALEDAASTRLQLTVCEQEVLAAKSDLAFLTQTLEESREAEASKAASLEYRISSLEDDREVLRQFHQDELENLRNELTHVSMEKDRILHSLKESEKKNAAIVFSTSKTSESDGSASPEAELSRLRVERAQLLTAAAEEGSRTEGRIREAVAAHVSSMEADIILERELRVAAEAAVEDIKFQMEALKEADRDEESREPTDENVNDSRSESFLDELSAELKQFKEENRVISAENDKLREELETANEKSQAAIDSLTEKWRKAQAKAHMLESSDRFDAEVNVEVAKLRSNGDAAGGHPRNWIVVHENDNPARDEGPPELSPVEAYDLIQQQKIAIQEERAMYLELLAEHDDLLALLAQQDLEKASLNAALSRVAGPEAVRAAMTDAEENAVKKYGKYLKLSP